MQDFRKLLKFAKPYSKSIVFAFFCLALTSSISLILPLLVRNIVNAVFVQKNASILNSLTFNVVVIIFLQATFAVTQNYILGFIGHRIVTDFRCELFSHLQTLSVRFFQNRRVGEILSRMSSDISVIQNGLISIPVAVLRQTITLVGGLAIILYLNWKLTGLILVAIGPLMIFARFFGKRLRDLTEKVQDKLAEASIILEEMVSSIKIVKSYTREKFEKERFEKEIENVFETFIAKVKISSFFGPFILMLTFLVSTILIWYGGHQVMDGSTTPGELAAFFLYAIIMAGPIGTFVRIYTQLQEMKGAIRRVMEIMETKPDIKKPESPIHFDEIKGSISFDNVCFGYEQGRYILKNICLEIFPGETVALVGPSGAGKSTIIYLLHRFFDPDQGTVRLDGNDIRQLNMQRFLEQIAYVPQDTILFGGSVRENILYGKLDANKDELENAAKKAHAHEFISKFPEGYDTLVGEKGVKLSTGERQRIAIARALLKNPKILILDEATSSLDNESEALIQEALDSLITGRTTLVIAHRLTTIQNADKIVALDRGQIVEVGSHSQLMDNASLYYRLYTIGMLESFSGEK